jgi:Ca2+-binding EF-hand superfamily protein
VTPKMTALLLLSLGLAAPAFAQDGRGMELMFTRLDADGNGEVSLEEITEARSQQFQRSDADGDGRVTLAELTAMQERIARLVTLPGAAPAERLRRQDLDGDGSLSVTEFTAPPPLFDLIDADGNGAISRAELDRARAALIP